MPNFANPRSGRALSGIIVLLVALESIAQAPPIFRHAFDDSVLDVSPKPGEVFTPAVESFHASGLDPYIGDATATAEGKLLYDAWCQGCHMPDGSGHMGPSLVDNVYIYDRVPTDAGLFEAIFAGAGGAMQSFADRMTQDEMLKVIAYVRDLQKNNLTQAKKMPGLWPGIIKRGTNQRMVRSRRQA
jgi:cytochrome c-L